MAAASSEDLGWLIIVVAFSGWFWLGGTPTVGEVSRYTATCTAISSDGACQDPMWLRPVTLRAIPEAQVVVGMIDGGVAFKNADCAVMDKENWSCRLPDGSLGAHMTDGEMAGGTGEIRYFTQLERLRCNKWLPVYCPANTGWSVSK